MAMRLSRSPSPRISEPAPAEWPRPLQPAHAKEMPMGLSSSKTKTTSNSTSNQSATTTPNLPQPLQTGLTGLTDKVNQLAGQDPYGTVAGISPLQDQAY